MFWVAAHEEAISLKAMTAHADEGGPEPLATGHRTQQHGYPVRAVRLPGVGRDPGLRGMREVRRGPGRTAQVIPAGHAPTNNSGDQPATTSSSSSQR